MTPLVNSVGQTYQGPVVLITDAQCYSACDIFAAGFQDHEIGPVLGVEANTGAGGANVVTHEELRTEWTDGGLKKLPKGVQMRVALRRCLRVGTRMGQPVEDLGVVPDALHEIAQRDLLEENADLMAAAGALLAQRQSRLLRFHHHRGRRQEAEAHHHHRLDHQHRRIRKCPTVATTATNDGTTQITIPASAGDVIRLEGYDPAGVLIAAARQEL